ncbi:uncharacterized protein JN550_012287 [Neoarthrinium moseri]|uniref:uncharacterized protein n=1 Tax=Neoarthrinium moseri TaxID=1658444 RepID=UPI001FDE7784|nr:uncharacterized protein JN550_012287 [Neoarthrinium moseri]KAI1858929.1 hypothetical protein JN550_012287 [Neoarthrinium moseri]
MDKHHVAAPICKTTTSTMNQNETSISTFGSESAPTPGVPTDTPPSSTMDISQSGSTIHEDCDIKEVIEFIRTMVICERQEDRDLVERRALRDSAYQGAHTARREAARHIEPSKNCAVFITNLAPDVQPWEIFDQLKNLDKVNFLSIMRPKKDRPNSAASVGFFTPEAARVMLWRTKQSSLMIRGQEALVRVDENCCPPREGLLGHTRVLIVEGKSCWACESALAHYLRLSGMYWQTDRCITTVLEDGSHRLEWRFCAYRHQAEKAYNIIKNELSDLVTVTFGRDPCVVE